MSDLEENMNKELTNIFNIEAKTNNQEVINQENVDAGESEKKKYRTSKPVRPFPQFSIKESMEISKVIGAQNAGNPWLVDHVATALNTSKSSNNFFI